MSLEQLSKTVDFVQATTPSNANDGETYLDTSLSPPRLKVFDGSTNAFVSPRSIQNLDAPVSAAGADLQFIGGFQLSLASFFVTFDVSGQDAFPRGVAFNGDGTAMFVTADGSNSVFQYSLNSGSDVGTASFSGTSFDVSGQTGTPRGVTFNGDGTAMFVIGENSDSVFQYSLNSGFDIGTASFSGTSFDVSVQADDPQGVAFNGDGTAMFVIGENSSSVFQYSLSSGFDIGTASFSGTSFDVSGQTGTPQGVAFNGDGTAMFVTGDNSGSVFQYSLSSGFDIGTASFTGTSFDVSGQTGTPRGVTFNGDGTAMFVIGVNSGSVFQYLVGEVGPK